jgi:hypothetical protein
MTKPNCESIFTMTEAVRVFFLSGGTIVILASLLVLIVMCQMVFPWQAMSVLYVLFIFFAWSVPEWLIHKCLMHQEKVWRLPAHMNALNRVHMAHHADPGDLRHALLRPQSICLGAMVSALGAGLVLQSMHISILTAIAFLLIAFNYNFVHFLSHTSVETRIPVLRQSLVNHRLHHQGMLGGYSLSNIWMDYLMGSILRRK